MFDSLSSSIQKVFSRWGKDRHLTEKNIRDGLEEIRTALLEADVHFQVARDLVGRVTERAVGAEVIEAVNPAEQIVKAFSDVLTEAMEGAPPDIPRKEPGDPTVVMMVGLQGSGKTTTSGKLARRLKKEGRRPLLVAADVRRPAAVQQLQILGERLEIPVHAVPGGDPPQICREAVDRARREGQDVVILDTAGRLHIDEPLMEELEKVAQLAPPDVAYLVCDSMAGQDAYGSAKAFHGRLRLDALILTKLDGDTRGGAAISVKSVTGKPVAYIGTGEGLQDLDPFHAERMASRILGMGDVVSLVEKAQEVMDEKEAEEAAERLFKSQFTFVDFLTQLRALRKMGPLAGILKMLPGGMGKAMEAAGGVDEKALKQVEAIILSMTERERQRPDLIEGSRRKRIARGSGVEIADVNQLMRQFEQMRRMMKQLGGGGLMSSMGRMMGGGGLGAMKEAMAGGGGMPNAGAGMDRAALLRQMQQGRSPMAVPADRQGAKKDRKRQKQARKKNRKKR